MNNWKKFTAACMGAAMVGTTVFGASATVFAADTVTLEYGISLQTRKVHRHRHSRQR